MTNKIALISISWPTISTLHRFNEFYDLLKAPKFSHYSRQIETISFPFFCMWVLVARRAPDTYSANLIPKLTIICQNKNSITILLGWIEFRVWNWDEKGILPLRICDMNWIKLNRISQSWLNWIASTIQDNVWMSCFHIDSFVQA